MAGRKVSGSPEALEQMIQKTNMFVEAQQRLIESLKRDYRSAGQDWNDSKYVQLGEVIDNTCRAIGASTPTLRECVTKLQALKRALEDFNNVRF